MSDTYICKERVYHTPANGGPRVFVADKGEAISMEVAVRLGLVSKPSVKKVTEAQVEDKAVKPSAVENKSSKKKA